MRAPFVASLVLCLIAAPVAAQQTPAPTGIARDPATATLLGVLITGGGQIYAGRPGKGLALLGIGLGAFTAGVLSSNPESCNVSYDVYGNPSTSCIGANYTPAVLGTLAYFGTWVYGWATAGGDARAYNAAHHQPVSDVRPILAPGRVGLAIALR